MLLSKSMIGLLNHKCQDEPLSLLEVSWEQTIQPSICDSISQHDYFSDIYTITKWLFKLTSRLGFCAASCLSKNTKGSNIRLNVWVM